MNDKKLKPCPFCGSKNLKIDESKDYDSVNISCKDCFVLGPLGYNTKTAIILWNHRNDNYLQEIQG